MSQQNYEFRSSEQICEMIIKECFNEDDKVSVNLILSSVPKMIEWLNENYGFLNQKNKIRLIIETSKMVSQNVECIEEFYTIDKYINEKLERFLENILELQDNYNKKEKEKENLNFDYDYYFISKHKNLFFMIISFLIFMMGSYTAFSFI
jgi:hypothetical protein